MSDRIHCYHKKFPHKITIANSLTFLHQHIKVTYLLSSALNHPSTGKPDLSLRLVHLILCLTSEFSNLFFLDGIVKTTVLKAATFKHPDNTTRTNSGGNLSSAETAKIHPRTDGLKY